MRCRRGGGILQQRLILRCASLQTQNPASRTRSVKRRCVSILSRLRIVREPGNPAIGYAHLWKGRIPRKAGVEVVPKKNKGAGVSRSTKRPGERRTSTRKNHAARPARIIARLPVSAEFARLLAAAPAKAGFDYPATLAGSTAHFHVYYQTGFANGPVIAQGVLATAERDYDTLLNLFGGLVVPTFPINIIIVSSIGGAHLDQRLEQRTPPAPPADPFGQAAIQINGWNPVPGRSGHLQYQRFQPVLRNRAVGVFPRRLAHRSGLSTHAPLAVAAWPHGFTASHLAAKIQSLNGWSESDYGPRRAAYDLKKFRAKNLARKIEGTRRYEILPQGLRALAALVVLRDKVIKPLLAASCHLKRGRKPKSPSPLDQHYDTLRTGMLGLFKELQIAA
jgi:hypothetical protein